MLPSDYAKGFLEGALIVAAVYLLAFLATAIRGLLEEVLS